jgi:glycosyltransferase involved in cell wall biosynthesis
MNISIVTTYALNYDTAPASRVLNIAKELLEYGFSVTIIGLHPGNDVETTCVRPVLLKNLNNPGKIKLMLYHHYLPIKVFWHSLSLKSDVFIIRGHILAGYLSPIFKLQKKKIIYDFHGFLYREEQNDFKHPYRQWLAFYTKFLENISVKLADRILVVSEGVRELIPTKYVDKTILLQNGVDLTEYNSGENYPEDCNIYE